MEFLIQNRLFQVMVRALQVPRCLNFFLSWVSYRRRVPGSDLKYRVRYIDTVFCARYLFHGEYTMLHDDAPQIRRVIDLGCNVGLFPLYLCSIRGNTDVEGILIDADAKVVKEARSNLALNHLQGLTVLHGLAAAGAPGDEREFWLTQNTTGSSIHPEQHKLFSGAKKSVVKIIDPLKEFDSRFGSECRIDLLKLDIEGAELDFLKTQSALLKRTDRVVIECHLPHADLESVGAVLRDFGMTLAAKVVRPPHPLEIGYFKHQTEAGKV